jgi:hydroxymethylglutaryl-CoA lyase
MRGLQHLIEGGVGTAFGCTLQGEVKARRGLRLMLALLDAGADRVSLADTVGYADPGMVARLFDKARALVGDKLWPAATFTTRAAWALANVYAALQTGCARFDACLAGIGGCPHAPGASGNVSTEDLAYHAPEHADRHGHQRQRTAGAAPTGGPLAEWRNPARHAVDGRFAQNHDG